jgi:hypothetical protein
VGSRSTGCFRYDGFDIDERAGVLVCRYGLDEWRFEERVVFGAGKDWNAAAVECARLVALLAGVSYYKAGAPPLIDLGPMAVRPGEADFLRSFVIDGLGEFAFKNELDLSAIAIEGGVPTGAAPAVTFPKASPLIPFGGGLDSIVTVELLRSRVADPALFILSRAGDRFDAIEAPAAVTGLPIVRAEREIDGRILQSAEHGFLNGHVPITGILSAIAALAAVLDGRGAVVMSNEWSASSANFVVDGRAVNHQYSKSLAFEDGFRSVVPEGVEYYSALRPFSELWIASRFAALTGYHRTFHSCNKAFALDPVRRQARWCGRCDKCCFIDLILSPFMTPDELGAIFDGREPLGDPTLTDQFRTLLDVSGTPKPFECVGDVRECRAAIHMAAGRADRVGFSLVHALAASCPFVDAGLLLTPIGPHHIPDAVFAAAALG